MTLILLVGALLGLVIAIAGVVLIIAADPLWGSVTLVATAVVFWWILRGLFRRLRRVAAEYEAYRSERPLPSAIHRRR